MDHCKPTDIKEQPIFLSLAPQPLTSMKQIFNMHVYIQSQQIEQKSRLGRPTAYNKIDRIMKKDRATPKKMGTKRIKMHGSPLKKNNQSVLTRSRSGINQGTNPKRFQPDVKPEKTRRTQRRSTTSNDDSMTPEISQPQPAPSTTVNKPIIRTRSMKKAEQLPSNNKIRIIIRKGQTPKAIYPVEDPPFKEQQLTTIEEVQKYYNKLMNKQAQRFITQRQWYEKQLASRSSIEQEMQKQIDELKVAIEKVGRKSRIIHN